MSNVEGNKVNVHFSDFFKISPEVLENYGAFNISIINDLPLFVDPFLIFNSRDERYKALHASIIKYIKFLRDKVVNKAVTDHHLKAWFMFQEVKQNWLGFSEAGNDGRGLGDEFARSLKENLSKVFVDFGNEKITQGSHIEKLCLIKDGVGRDNISDFTVNLIKGYLLEYTQEFGKKHLAKEQMRKVQVGKVRFNYETETWETAEFTLPYLDDYIILTPRDILTRDSLWINRQDLYKDYERIVEAVSDGQLRAQINNYFNKVLPKKASADEKKSAIADVIQNFPDLLDRFIKEKENLGEQAESISTERVEFAQKIFIEQLASFLSVLKAKTGFYNNPGDTLDEARERVKFLKETIEDNDGYKIFYANEKVIEREKDIHVLFKLTWFGSPSEIDAEVNNGRGPVDFKVSRGALDKSIVEFKLASNPQLKRNLKNQLDVYKKANKTRKGLKVIIYFTEDQLDRVNNILKELEMSKDPDVVLIDARSDNKPSASRA